jgi:adenylate cyclase
LKGDAVRTSANDFADSVFKRYNELASPYRIYEGAGHAAIQKRAETGHPRFSDLELGETRYCDIFCIFLDMSAFTRRTFWDDETKVVYLALAVLNALCQTVQRYGGFVLGLRGDGIFAGFGEPGSNQQSDAALGLGSAAVCLDACRTVVNPRLEQLGIEPIQIRAGADAGRVSFTRIGTAEASEVNVIGFSANFASKCEKAAASWEIVIGEGAAKYVHPGLLNPHSESPKSYQRNYLKRQYEFFVFDWEEILDTVADIPDELAGKPSKALDCG